MARQNRVDPYGEVIRTSARGLVYGNRGCLHDADGRIRRHHSGHRWIACRLRFRGWHRAPLMQPGRFTELFFLDEATALAAGHRPCALCRREDYRRFQALWSQTHAGLAGADTIDEVLQAERWDAAARQRRLHLCSWDELPDGTVITRDGTPWLVLGRELLQWRPDGYAARAARPGGEPATVLTPPSLMSVLAAGWESAVPLLHPSSQPASRCERAT